LISIGYKQLKSFVQIFSKLYPSISLGGIWDIKGLRSEKLGNAFSDIRFVAVDRPASCRCLDVGKDATEKPECPEIVSKERKLNDDQPISSPGATPPSRRQVATRLLRFASAPSA
jgi:hypothetical protein